MKRKIDIAALLLIIVGALNWGLIGLYQLDAISWLFGGPTAVASRVIYVIVAMAGLWCINLITVHARIRADDRVDLRS